MQSSCSHHLCGGAVLVPLVEVTPPVVGLDEASEPAVQSEVRHVVRGEHQQVVGLLPPPDLRLFTAEETFLCVLNLIFL